MAERTSRFEVYADKGGSWRWRLIASNGTQVGASGEGFDSKSNAKRAVESARRAAAEAAAEITEVESA